LLLLENHFKTITSKSTNLVLLGFGNAPQRHYHTAAVAIQNNNNNKFESFCVKYCVGFWVNPFKSPTVKSTFALVTPQKYP